MGYIKKKSADMEAGTATLNASEVYTNKICAYI